MLLPAIVLLQFGVGCAPKESCGLSSSVPGYVPACDAWLVTWPDETRLFVDEILVVYFPSAPRPGTTYGGTTGNPITVLLEDRLAEPRETTVEFGGELSEIWLDASFDDGEVIGPVTAGFATEE